MPAEFDPEKRTVDSYMPFFKAPNLSQMTSGTDSRNQTDEDMEMEMESLFANSEDERIWLLLNLYVDGEASPVEAAEVEAMLQHDAAYARAHGFMLEAGGAIRTITEIEPPADLRDAILARTTRRPTLFQRVSMALATLQSRLVLPGFSPMGRLALAGGGLVATALVAGIVSGNMSTHSSSNGLPLLASTSPTRTDPIPVTHGPVQSPSETGDGSNGGAIEVRDVHSLILPQPGIQEVAHGTGAPATEIGTAVRIVRPGYPDGASKVDKSVATVASVGAKTSLRLVPYGNRGASPRLASETASRLQGPTRVDDDGATQNINPMMDNNVQHHSPVLAMLPPGSGNETMDADDLNDRPVVPGNSTTDAPADMTGNSQDQETRSTVGRRIEGQIIASKLPPTARHIYSPGEVARQMSNTVPVSLTSGFDNNSHRSAEVKLLSTKF